MAYDRYEQEDEDGPAPDLSTIDPIIAYSAETERMEVLLEFCKETAGSRELSRLRELAVTRLSEMLNVSQRFVDG